jgi:hypothetical protein
VRRAFPNPPDLGFVDNLSEDILADLCRKPPADPEARVREIIAVAEMMVRHNNGLRALYEFAACVEPEIERRLRGDFQNWPQLWTEVRDKFVSKLADVPLKAERAAEAVAFATKVSRRLVLDFLDKKGPHSSPAPRVDDQDSPSDLLTNLPDTAPRQEPPESEGCGRQKLRLS